MIYFCIKVEIDIKKRRENIVIVVDRPKYKMAIYEQKKEFHVQIHGYVNEAIANEYLQDLSESTSKFNKSAFKLVVDATHQVPLPAKVAANLGDIMMSYGTLGFKDIAIVNSKSKIAEVQIRNAMENRDFPGIIVKHISEIK